MSSYTCTRGYLRPVFGAVLALTLTLSGAAQISGTAIAPSPHQGPDFLGYVQDEVIVTLTPSAGSRARAQGSSANVLGQLPEFAAIAGRLGMVRSAPQFARFAQTAPANAAERRMANQFKVSFASDLETALDALSGHPLVEKVEPIGVHRVTATPNDTFYDDPPASFPHDQWHYWDTYGIDADLAWDTTTGAQDVVVAVLDTGVRYFHTDLGGPNAPWDPNNPQTNGNIWTNAGEIPANGADDDGNGFVDDTVGYDFVASTQQAFATCIDADCGGADNDPRDGDGHGTHVSGTVAAITNNGRGVAGIAGGYSDGTTSGTGNGCKVMSLRIGWHANILGSVGGVVRMDYAAQAMDYVAAMVDDGVNVAAINCSWGSSNSGGIDAAVDNLLAHDVMIVHAAGNSNANDPGYLGGKAGVMNVGATDATGNAAGFSNFGTWVDLAAPGVDIMSTYHNPDDPIGDYVALFSGTSMSAPHVCGVAALLESYSPALTGPDKFALMVNTATAYLGSKNVGSGIVSANNALAAATPPCEVVAGFSADFTSGCSPLIVGFSDTSTGPVATWSWDFGDGANSTEASPIHEYTLPGTYTVTLTVSSATCSDSEVKTDYITVLDTPTANFSATPASGAAPLAVAFTDQSTESPTSWLWEFGDGETSVLQSPLHVYDTPGLYTVTLTVNNGCSGDSVTQVDYIEVLEAPPATISLAQSDLPQSGTVQGSYADTHVSDDVYEVVTEVESKGKPSNRTSVAEHSWEFNVPPAASVILTVEARLGTTGEGELFLFESSTDNQTFYPLFFVATTTDLTYSAALPDGSSGTVYIRVEDIDRTAGNRLLDSIYIDHLYIESSGTANQAPVVTISNPADGANVAPGTLITFMGSAVDAEEGDLTANLTWTSNLDGTIGSGGSFVAVLGEGTHTITAYVDDSGGKTGSDVITVNVGTPPPALFVYLNTDKASYFNGETVLIEVIVADGPGLFDELIPGASVHVVMTTPKGHVYTGDGVTDIFGLLYFTHTINGNKDGFGTYLLEATASKAGYTDGQATTTFEAVR